MIGVRRMSDKKAAWLQARKKCLCSTDISKMLGVGFGGPEAVYADKRSPEIFPSAVPESLQIKFDVGTLLQPYVAELYRDAMGGGIHDQDGRIFRSGAFPWAGTSLDYLTSEEEILECKTVQGAWGGEWGEALTDQIPTYYYLQIQWQMGIMKLPLTSLAALMLGFSPEFRIYRIEFDAVLFDKLIEIGGEFWQHVQAGTLPAGWNHGKAPEALKRCNKFTAGKTIQLGADTKILVDAWQEQKELANHAKARAEEMRGEIETILGDAETGILPDGSQIRRSETERDGYTVEPTKVRTLRYKKARS